MAALSRFDELRMKTDKQLIQLVHVALNLGICEARHALKFADTWALAEDRYVRTRKLFADAARLIPLTGEIPEEDRNRLETKLAHLREMLEGLLVLRHPATTGDNIPALARALWKAKGSPEGSAWEDWFQAERALRSQTACLGN
jgi:hypothetical protein